MKRSNRKRHRPEEVVAKLRQADEALAKGTPIAEVARSLGVSEVTLHRRRAEYGAASPARVLEGQFAHPGDQPVPIRVRRRRAALRAAVLARHPADTPLGHLHHHRHVLDRPAPPRRAQNSPLAISFRIWMSSC